MNVDERAVVSFGRAAEAYERSRPGYPAGAVAWLAEKLGLGPGRTVVDLGAGTGKLSRLLVETGARVVAVEPVEEMRRLLETVAGVQALAGTAEAIPLPDASADACTVAQAFHWFEPVAALAEIHRVLRPDSALALLWNRLDEADPLTAAFTAVLARHRAHPPVGHAWPEGHDRTALFTPCELRTFANVQELDAEALTDRLASESSIAVLPEERRRQALGEVRVLAPRKVVLRYVTEVYVSNRRA
jgi:ubiquinone/menaquinone biosynthesis C-methylase UbiE